MNSYNIIFAIFAGLMCINTTYAHTYVSSLVVEGKAYDELDCIRPYGNNYNFPIPTVSDSSMTCGVPAGNANRKCPISAGANVGIQWHYEMPGAQDSYIVDPSHRGPCMVYMAKSDTGAGPVWFKIFEEGYNAQTNQFCVDRILASPQKGLLNFKIPAGLPAGNYLLRGEIIALHGAYAQGGSQPYVHCAEITITNGGNVAPSSDYLVALPGAYSPTDPGLLISVYQPIKNYVVPGPKVWTGASSSGNTPTPVAKVTTGRTAPITTGARPVTTGAVKPPAKVTTGAVKPPTKVTTGRAGSVTTGARKAVTTGAPVPPQPQPQPSGSCSGSDMKCIDGSPSQYSMCSNNIWGAQQQCGAGLVCQPSGNVIYCVRPATVVEPITPGPSAPVNPVSPTENPSSPPECTQATLGYQVCSGDYSYKTCVHGDQGQTTVWSQELKCQVGLMCHPSQTANNIYCY